jgi:chromosome segregation ATPase
MQTKLGLPLQQQNIYFRPLAQPGHNRIEPIESQKYASSLGSRPRTGANEMSLPDFKQLESHVKHAADQFNQLEDKVARLASLMESRDDSWDQTQTSHDRILRSLNQIQDSQDHIRMRQEQLQNSQDQIHSHISRQEEEMGTRMDILVQEISKLGDPQSHALVTTRSGLSTNEGSSKRKKSNRTPPTQKWKRESIQNKVQSKGEVSGRRRSSRLAGTVPAGAAPGRALIAESLVHHS